MRERVPPETKGEEHQHGRADYGLRETGKQGEEGKRGDPAALADGLKQPQLRPGDTDLLSQEVGVEPHLHGHRETDGRHGQPQE